MTIEPSSETSAARRRASLGFGLLLAGLLTVTYPDVVVGTGSFFFRDFGVLAYPTVHFQREAFWRGELPLWNPLSHCGVPFLAQWGTMALYPGALLYLLLPLPWSLNGFCLAHLGLAGLGFYRLGRRWTGSSLGGAVAGMAFVFNGVTQSCLLWPNWVAALGWMPWVIEALCDAAQGGGTRITRAALLGAAQFLTGAPEAIALTWLVGVSLGLIGPVMGGGLAAQDGVAARPQRSVGRSAAAVRMGLAAVLVGGLGAAQWLPFLDLLAHSQRAGGVAADKWALPPAGLVNLLVPFVGSHRGAGGVYFQPGQAFFSSVYLGALPLVLGVVGTVWRRDRSSWALGALGGAGVLLALGDATPIGRWLHLIGSFGGAARYPVKWLVVAAGVVPLLAARCIAGLETASSHTRPTGLRAIWLAGFGAAVLIGVASVAIGPGPASGLSAIDGFWSATLRCGWLVAGLAALAGALPRGGTPTPEPAEARRGDSCWQVGSAMVLAAVVWLDFLTHAPRQNPTLRTGMLTDPLPDRADLPIAGRGRVFITPAAEARLLRSPVADPSADFLGKRLARWSNLNLLDGVPKVNGALTLRVREQDEIERWLYRTNALPAEAWLDFLGVQRESAPANPTEWRARATALPLVTAGRKVLVTPADATWTAVTNAAFDPRTTVVLSPGEPRGRTAPEGEVSAGSAGHVAAGIPADAVRATARMDRFSARRIEFEVVAERPTVAVLAATFHPNWQVRVNDEPASVWRANHAFLGIPVPAGTSRVALEYRDRRLMLGTIVSGTTLFACLAVARRGRSRGREDLKPPVRGR